MEKQRTCLKCRRKFLSSGAGNRVCVDCNKKNKLAGKVAEITVVDGIRVNIIN